MLTLDLSRVSSHATGYLCPKICGIVLIKNFKEGQIFI